MAATYFHVIDEDNGEHIATYTNHWEAWQRATKEIRDNGRDFCNVTTSIPTVTVNSAVTYQ